MTTTWICKVGRWELGVWELGVTWWAVARPVGATSGSQLLLSFDDDDGYDCAQPSTIASVRVSVRREMGHQIPWLFSLRDALWLWTTEFLEDRVRKPLAPSHFRACNIRCPRRRARYTPRV